VRLLPLPRADAATAARVRHEALELAEQDRSFTPLRAKIHNVPDAGDAAKVREYARTRAPAKLRKRYEKLASDIDDLYASGGAAQTLEDLTAVVTSPALAAPLREAATALRSASGPGPALAAVGGAEERLALLEASLQLEDDAYTLGTSLLAQMQGASRRERLAWLRHTGDALYGVGFLAQRQRDGIRDAVDRIGANTALTVDAYREELRYLARAPEWSSRWLEFNFGTSVTHWRPIEPLVDANRMAGIEHDLFGETVGSGLRALNPGLTRGALVAPEGAEVPEGGFTRDGVYLLPESIADLPRVSGILTRGEGSSLSHLQLLARNLGIPNVVVGEEHVPVVRQRDGDQVVLAVSPLGVVQLVRYGERWEAIFGKERPEQGLVIRPDLEKLDLRPTLIPLSKLRARDSGRLSGPKGANLGELKHHFGDAVPDGFVISFGVFRQVLNQPIEPGGPPVFDWMKQQYARIDGLQGAEKERAISSFLARLRRWIETCDPGRGLRQGLRMALDRLGAEGSFGVFVRSDTNVNVLAAVKQVWASPFTERAYGWRQSHMEQPEYVFPAVVVQRSFPSEKSGVLVTVDVDSGQPGWLSIAVNEGVGGAVEGQAAESLRVDAASGEVRVLAIATSPRRAELSPRGGVTRVPASGEQAVLQPDEIRQLMQFASTVSRRFPSLRDEDGSPLPADVEFAFRGGRLTLLQIRPFVESRSAQQSNYLSQLDASFRQRGASRVELDAAPREPSG
jgi:phosphohistidine swiveling domain-containing protein